MQEHELPTWNDIVESAVAELDNARNGLSEAAAWLRSDWRPLGSPLPEAAGDARHEVLVMIGRLKGEIDEAKGRLHAARR